MSREFERWRDWFNRNWCSVEQLCELTELEQITKEEYKQITGLTYPSVQE
jgi:uncharacterized XkdX family phage protein